MQNECMAHQSFSNVLITPYEELLNTPSGLSDHRGGPLWPMWDSQVLARHCRNRVPVDIVPTEVEAEAVYDGKMAWMGPIVGHYGHMIADFSMRMLPTVTYEKNAVLAFGKHKHNTFNTIDGAPAFVGSILDWFDVPRDRTVIIEQPTLAAEIVVYGQQEQLDNIGPSADYLDLLDALSEKKLGSPVKNGRIFVSRAGQPIRFAGESYLEFVLGEMNVRTVRPENISLREQLEIYRSAEILLFSEGSALHSLQLLGRGLGDIFILTRRPGARMITNSLSARAESVRYSDVVKTLVPGVQPTFQPAAEAGLSFLDIDILFETISSMGLPIHRVWSQTEYEAAVDRDIGEWLAWQNSRLEGASAWISRFIDSHAPEARTLFQSRLGFSRQDTSGDAAVQGTEAGDRLAADPASPAVSEHASSAGRSPWSVRRINQLARWRNAKSYLEIGVATEATFGHINIPERTGVNPLFRFDAAELRDDKTTLSETTSDEFFRILPIEQKYDIIFLAGHHTFEQTYRDFCNSIAHSHDKTVWVIDNTLPDDVFSSLRDENKAVGYRYAAGGTGYSWHGDTFKIVFCVHDFHLGMNYRTIVGSGNPQTLIWRSNKEWHTPFLDSLEKISRLSYFDLLENERIMRYASEEEAFAVFRNS